MATPKKKLAKEPGGTRLGGMLGPAKKPAPDPHKTMGRKQLKTRSKY